MLSCFRKSVFIVSVFAFIVGPAHGVEPKKQGPSVPTVRDKNNEFADAPSTSVDRLLTVVKQQKDVDKLLEWAVFFEAERKFDYAIRFADEALSVVPRSESIKFLRTRIKAKQLKESGLLKEAKELIEGTLNASESIIFEDFSEGQKGGPFVSAPNKEDIRAAKIREERLQKLPVKAFLWQSAGKTSSRFLHDAQVYELGKKTPQLGKAFVLAREAYVLGGTKSGSIRYMYGRAAVAYSKELYEESRRKEADSILREYLSTPCVHFRKQAEEVLKWHGTFRPYKGDFGPYPDDFDYSR